MALTNADLPKLVELLNLIDIRVQLRRRTAAEWTAGNEVLLAGEVGLETDTGKRKTGGGVTPWNSLPYDLYRVATLVDAPTIAVDATLADNFRVVLGGNRTFDNPTNLADGQTFNVRIIQDAIGTRLLTFGNKFQFPGGIAPTLSTAPGAVDLLSCQYDAADDTILAVLNLAFA